MSTDVQTISKQNLIKQELIGLWTFLKSYKQEIIVIATTLLGVILYYYQPIVNYAITSLVYFGILPLGVIILVLRKNPIEFGVGLGNPKIWLFYVLITCLIATLLLLIALMIAQHRDLESYYKQTGFNFWKYSLVYFVALLSQEFCLRGFMLFGLKNKFQQGAIFIQTIPFVLLHIGKPEIEVISTIFTGIYFGYIAYRGNSFWPMFIIHMFINLFFVTLINFY